MKPTSMLAHPIAIEAMISLSILVVSPTYMYLMRCILIWPTDFLLGTYGDMAMIPIVMIIFGSENNPRYCLHANIFQISYIIKMFPKN